MDHPNIVKMHEFREDDKFFYIISELWHGDDLYKKFQ
jgi:calcium-dependent protein kinase